MTTDRELQGGAGTKANLSVLSTQDGNPTTVVLHANKTVYNLTISSAGGGVAVGLAGSRASRTLTITGDLTVASGTFRVYMTELAVNLMVCPVKLITKSAVVTVDLSWRTEVNQIHLPAAIEVLLKLKACEVGLLPQPLSVQ